MKSRLKLILELLIWITLGILTLIIEVGMVVTMIAIRIGLYIWQLWLDIKMHGRALGREIQWAHADLWSLFKKVNPRWRKDATHGAKEYDSMGY